MRVRAEVAGGGRPARDGRRVRSLIGLVLSRLGPTAHNAVSGTMLTLLVASRTSSAFLVAFATTAHNLFGWISLPLVGRFSDRASTKLGRRIPVMVGALSVMAAGTYVYPAVDDFWLVAGAVVVVRTAASGHGVTAVAAIPEIFGRHVWAKAAGVVAVAGGAVSIMLRATVVGTWEADDPSTWVGTFRLAALVMALAAVALVVMVREARAVPQTRAAAEDVTGLDTDGSHAAAAVAGDMAGMVPDRRLLGLGFFLAVASAGATGYLFPVYAVRYFGASPADLALYTLWSGPPALLGGAFGAVWVQARVTRRTLAIGAPLVLSAVAAAHMVATALWQAALLGVVAAVAAGALTVAMAPLLLQLLPRRGGFGERLGRLYGPIVAVAVGTSYLAGVAADALGDLRVIWLFAAGFGVVQAALSTRLRSVAGHEHTDLGRVALLVAAALRSRRGRRSLVRGDLSESDVDTEAVLDALRDAADPARGEPLPSSRVRRRNRRTARAAVRYVVPRLARRRSMWPGLARLADRLGGGYLVVAARVAAAPEIYGRSAASAVAGCRPPASASPDADPDGDVARTVAWAAAVYGPDSAVTADLRALATSRPGGQVAANRD